MILRVLLNGVEQTPSPQQLNGSGSNVGQTHQTEVPIHRNAADSADFTIRVEIEGAGSTVNVLAGGRIWMTAERRIAL